MKIYLIRHGETTGDIEDRYGGDYDDNLTEKGKKESRELAEKLKNKGIEIIYHSPRIRAIETTKIVNAILKTRTQIIRDLRERNNYGVLTGMTRKEAKEKYPEEVENLKIQYHHKVKGSEDYLSFEKRMNKAFHNILDQKEYDAVAIITHGGPIKFFVREIMKLGELKALDDCAILEVEKNKDGLKLIKTDGVVFEKDT